MDVGVVLGDRYELLEVVGTGGMGQVWRAHDRLLGRPVAVKVLGGEPAATARGVQRLRDEASRAAQVRHPNVVQVLDAVFDEDVACIVMELIDGPDLAAAVPAEGLPLEQALLLVDGIAAGLHAVHRAGIVHRDLSPRNVLLDDGVPRLTDFGVARSADPTVEVTQTVRGSVSYLSPEQATGGEVGPPADVYALGCLLTMLLTGSPPFDAEAPIGVVHQHVNAAAPDLRERRPDVPVLVADAVAAALAKDPADRPTDVVAFLDALGRPHDLGAVATGAGGSRTAMVGAGVASAVDGTSVLPTAAVLDVGSMPTTAVEPLTGTSGPAGPVAATEEAELDGRGALPPVVADRPDASRLALVAGLLLVLVLASIGWAVTRPSGTVDPLAIDDTPAVTGADRTPLERLDDALAQLHTTLGEQRSVGRVGDAAHAALEDQLASIDARVVEGRIRDAEVELGRLREVLAAHVADGEVTDDAESALSAAADALAAALADVDDTFVAEEPPAPATAPAADTSAQDPGPSKAQSPTKGKAKGKSKGKKGK